MQSVWKLTIRIYVTAQTQDGEQYDQVLNSRETHWSSEKRAKQAAARYQSMIDELDFRECISISITEIPLGG